ncbi:MAG TPA: hypothetical protein VGR48_14650 [Terriglobales bacterium]|nr:hypothetical protein [Terriglobales bacterium]
MTTPESSAGASAQGKLYVTIAGLPLKITLEWPFHRSGGGADYFVLHGDIRLENTEGLHVPVAVNLTQTVREALPSLDPKDTEAPVINALRKEVDNRQLEFLKSPKLLPVPFSSRFYDLRRKQWTFQHASEAELNDFIRRKIYWEHKLGSGGGKSWLTDPVDMLYLGTTSERMLDVARHLAAQGMLLFESGGQHAASTEALLAQAQHIEAEMRRAQQELEKKHAFERG